MYETLYHHLFNAITDALNHMEDKNYGLAETRLKEAQQAAEKMYMEEDDAQTAQKLLDIRNSR